MFPNQPQIDIPKVNASGSHSKAWATKSTRSRNVTSNWPGDQLQRRLLPAPENVREGPGQLGQVLRKAESQRGGIWPQGSWIQGRGEAPSPGALSCVSWAVGGCAPVFPRVHRRSVTVLKETVSHGSSIQPPQPPLWSRNQTCSSERLDNFGSLSLLGSFGCKEPTY